MCGASPVEASSGKTVRHRLNRGGDRAANNALWTIAFVRLVHDPRTRAYAAKRTAQGSSRKEVLRCLKRTIAREPAYKDKPQIFVAVGICTHLGCSPTYRPEIAPGDLGADWVGGFFCPCHQSKFDLAGRVFKGVPAPTNLVIPPYKFLSDSRVVIGEGGKAA